VSRFLTNLAQVTHAADDPPPTDKPPSAFELPDWRPFRTHCDALTFDVTVDDQNIVLAAPLGHPTALQGTIAAFCRAHALNGGQCVDLAAPTLAAAAGAARAVRLGLPATPQKRPTPEDPFVFLHHEKCAGSSIRRHVVRAAFELGAGFYAPCYDGGAAYREDERCYAFDLGNASALNGGPPSALAAVAGHFQYSSAARKWRHGMRATLDASVPPISLKVG